MSNNMPAFTSPHSTLHRALHEAIAQTAIALHIQGIPYEYHRDTIQDVVSEVMRIEREQRGSNV